MKLFISFATLLVLSSIKTQAQSYQQLADSALHTMWGAQDTTGERKALLLYQKAFKLYPDKIDELGLYKASVLAGNVLDFDTAFLYLNKVIYINQGWIYVVGLYGKSEYKNLLTDKRWPVLVAKAKSLKDHFHKDLANKEKQLFSSSMLATLVFDPKDNRRKIYEKITLYNNFIRPKEYEYSLLFKINDSIKTSYFVSLPADYDPKKSYPLMFFLHGAVNSNALIDFQKADDNLGGWNRYYTKYARSNEVIMVYPKGSRKYNWMFPDDGFFMVPEMLKKLKEVFNINDNKVFITGHSNGATGSFSYLMKEQSPFAGFYGFNTQPKVRTGGTFIKNISNRSYFNISTDQDYYYPPNANNSMDSLMKTLHADYQDKRYNGFPHWFPQFDESEPAYKLLFTDLKKRSRNPFHDSIYWECDDVKYGRCDWIEIKGLDTTGSQATWQKHINFNISKWLVEDKKKAEKYIFVDTVLNAFNFPHQSGAVQGNYKNNIFRLQTSQVKSLVIFISPEMVDMNKPVMVYINGKKKAEYKPKYNRNFMIRDFEKTADRKAVWVDQITVSI